MHQYCTTTHSPEAISIPQHTNYSTDSATVRSVDGRELLSCQYKAYICTAPLSAANVADNISAHCTLSHNHNNNLHNNHDNVYGAVVMTKLTAQSAFIRHKGTDR